MRSNIVKKIFLVYKFIVKHFPTRFKRKFKSIRPLEKLNLSLRARLKPDFVIIEGHKFFLDTYDSLNFSVYGICEPFESEVIKKYVKEGDTVLDLGANIGYYSLLLAKLVGKSGRVYAFEPEPSNFALLKKNIEANNYKNIIPIQKAVSDKREKIILYSLEYYSTGNKIHNSSNENLDSIEVESISLDDFFKKKKIDFIKMDIEGSEGRAIRGMQKLIKENEDIKIVSEFDPVLLRGCGVDAEGFFKMLMLKGFELHNINEQQSRIEFFNPKKATSYLNGEGYTNLLCIKKKQNQ